MVSLLKNKILVFIFPSLMLGCATTRYYANKEKPSGTDIEITPDRVIAECEFITDYEGDYPNPYGFMIHILDSRKTVLTVSSGTVLEKKYCFELLKVAEKIIKNAQVVTVRGRGDAEGTTKVEEFSYYFPAHGTFFGNSRSLNFLGIWNDKGQCHSAFNGAGDFCLKQK